MARYGPRNALAFQRARAKDKDGWNYSQVLSVLRAVHGPFARIKKRDGLLFAGIQAHGGPWIPLGNGKTYADLIDQIYLKPMKAREDGYLEPTAVEEPARGEESSEG